MRAVSRSPAVALQMGAPRCPLSGAMTALGANPKQPVEQTLSTHPTPLKAPNP
jgi:hypothetical protein